LVNLFEMYNDARTCQRQAKILVLLPYYLRIGEIRGYRIEETELI